MLSMIGITRELMKLTSLALLLLAGLAKHFGLLILHFNRLLMKRFVGSSQSKSWVIMAVGLVWILGGIVLVVLVVLLSLGWLRL
jgi:nitrate reductase gamma subunit